MTIWLQRHFIWFPTLTVTYSVQLLKKNKFTMFPFVWHKPCKIFFGMNSITTFLKTSLQCRWIFEVSEQPKPALPTDHWHLDDTVVSERVLCVQCHHCQPCQPAGWCVLYSTQLSRRLTPQSPHTRASPHNRGSVILPSSVRKTANSQSNQTGKPATQPTCY